jgi:hypothetical protein
MEPPYSPVALSFLAQGAAPSSNPYSSAHCVLAVYAKQSSPLCHVEAIYQSIGPRCPKPGGRPPDSAAKPCL